MTADRTTPLPPSVTNRPLPRQAKDRTPVFCFSLRAAADPGVMPRVLALFAKRSLVPQRWHSDLIGARGEGLAIDIQVAGLTPQLTEYIARCLRQIHGVETVLTAEKRFG